MSEIKTSAKHVVIFDRRPSDGGSIPPASTNYPSIGSQVTDAELDALEAEANSNIELKEFIPIEKVDPVYFEGAHYLAPDEGGDKAYRLVADAMEKSGRVALTEMVSRGKENF